MKKIILLFLIPLCLLTVNFCFANCTDADYSIANTTITTTPERYNPEGQEVYVKVSGQCQSTDINICSIEHTGWVHINYDGPDPADTTEWNAKIWVDGGAGHVFTAMTNSSQNAVFAGSGPHIISAELCCKKGGTYADFSKESVDAGFWFCKSFYKEIYPSTITIPPDDKKPTLNPLACESLGECFDAWATVLLYVSIAGVSIVIFIAALIFITGGTPDRLALAKKIVLWGIGIFVIMLLVKIIASVSKNNLNP